MNKRKIIMKAKKNMIPTLFGDRYVLRIRTAPTEIDPLDFCWSVRGSYMTHCNGFTYHTATIKLWDIERAVPEIVKQFNRLIGRGNFKIKVV